MLVLGLGGSNHDFSACLVRDGEVRVAIEEERLARVKYSVGVNALFHEGWRYCLDTEGVELDELDAVVADDALLPTATFRFRSRTTLIRHHVAHAASCFYPSPFPTAAVLVVDGAGSLVEGRGVETLTTGVGDGTRIDELTKVFGANYTTDGLSPHRIYQAGDSDNSLGFMYKAVSREIGFVAHEHGDWSLTEDGKTMGLAPFGGDRHLDLFRQHLELHPDGTFSLHLRDGGLVDRVQGMLAGLEGDERMARAADLAWAAQTILEDALVHVARHLHRETGLTRLCMAGGVALNCVANGKVLRETPFEDIFVQPAASDSGCAIGSALHGYHVLGERPRVLEPAADRRWARHAYYGRPTPAADVDAALDAAGLPHAVVDEPARLAARLLADGELLAWFEGASEFGPRALGHRSILADPRTAEMKDVLNRRIKHREDFRPFAPAVLVEHVSEYFDLDIASPFMLLVAPVRPEHHETIPAVVHVDGTARVQTVSDVNGAFRTLVEHFHLITGVPVVLNTSLNDSGQAIVETPAEALELFAASDLDHLFLDGRLVAHDGAALDRALARRAAVGSAAGSAAAG